MSSAAIARTQSGSTSPPGFTTNSANTASHCLTAGRQRPQARLLKMEGQSPGIRRPKAGNAGAARAPCTASPLPRCFTMPTRPIPAGEAGTIAKNGCAFLRVWRPVPQTGVAIMATSSDNRPSRPASSSITTRISTRPSRRMDHQGRDRQGRNLELDRPARQRQVGLADQRGDPCRRGCRLARSPLQGKDWRCLFRSGARPIGKAPADGHGRDRPTCRSPSPAGY